MKLSGAVFAAVLVLVAAGATIATAGVGSLVTSGDNGVEGKASQAPIGTLSATPPPNRDVGGDEVGDNLGERGSGGENSPANDTQALNQQAVTGSGGEDAGTLPFAGFLAIPVLLAGAAMLVGGVVLRRRAAEPASA